MTAAPITWPRVDATTVAALRRLGRGLRLAFQVAGECGELVLEPGLAPTHGVVMSFDSQCGVVTLGDAGVLLSLFGECPVMLADRSNDPQSWFWALFEQCLSPQLAALFGYLRPLEEVQQGAMECRLSVVLGASRGVGRLMLGAQTLLRLCDAGAWQAIRAPLCESFAVAVPVELGRLPLTLEQLRMLRPADVLVPECLLFSADGMGQLSMGRLRLLAQIDDDGGRRCLTIGSIEESAVDDVEFADAGDEGPADDEPFATLSLQLSVRCGVLRLSLAQLRLLAPGQVLDIAGYDPGMAGLYYGDRAIGHGQLVEVDGRLGLQLSRIIFSQ